MTPELSVTVTQTYNAPDPTPTTCFLSVVNGDWSLPGEAITFGEATARLVRQVGEPGPPLHLVLEAPLSAFFDAQGNPVGREGERRGSQTRYWL